MKKSWAVLAAVIGVTGCSNERFDSGRATEQWNRYHAETISQTTLNEGQVLTVFYRDQSLSGEAADVYVNGDYHASLLASSFSPVAVCGGEAIFSAVRVSSERFTRRDEGKAFQLTPGETHYFKLVEASSGQLSVVAVPAEQAKAELAGLQGEIRHTLSRVSGKANCAPKATQATTLSASALWGLAKYSYADMSEQGKQELAAFAEAVKQNPSITRIEISGFTDPDASEAYNLALSQRRAETVRHVLLKAGVKQTIQATGYGETRLVVDNCRAKHANHRAARVACNLPNRRIEIATYAN